MLACKTPTTSSSTAVRSQEATRHRGKQLHFNSSIKKNNLTDATYKGTCLHDKNRQLIDVVSLLADFKSNIGLVTNDKMG